MAPASTNGSRGTEAYRVVMLVGLGVLTFLATREVGQIDKSIERSQQTQEQLAQTNRTVDETKRTADETKRTVNELGEAVDKIDSNLNQLSGQVNQLSRSVEELRDTVGVKLRHQVPAAIDPVPAPPPSLSPENRARQKWQRR